MGFVFEANSLIALYSFVEEKYETVLQFDCWRRSNNRFPHFTDVEVITVYLYGVHVERRFRIKDIYDFARRHMRSWFPELPSYQAFNRRINWLADALQKLARCTLTEAIPVDCKQDQLVVDSLPIITCSSKRAGKVARGLTAKGFCSTKGMYYYGLKLHIAGLSRVGTIPYPDWVIVTSAEDHDLTTFKEHKSVLRPGIYYGDKIYFDQGWFRGMAHRGVLMRTPVKLKAGDPDRIRQYNKAADDVYSRAVSSIRQPIESLFNWIITHTDIQRASLVRSTAGLIVHVFGKLTAAYLGAFLNP